MDARELATLSRLLDEALDLHPDAREPWVAALDDEYEPMKPRLRRLLDELPSLDESSPLNTLPRFDLEDTPLVEGGDQDDRAPDSVPGPETAVGPYRLVRLLAEGGMGTVWLATRVDGLLKRPVALKLPHGAWRRADLAGRMARERDILASLTHPHIARLYDAGVTADGRPYLAIEHIEGRPIDEYCRAQGLAPRNRVALVRQVAQAVAYAHAALVVHRDLKPANILVTADGQARLLDFGVAKLLDEAGADPTATLAGGPAFTPAYAAPEQVSGAPIGVGTDVYAIGVLLFELLTGTRPYRANEDSWRQLSAAILESRVPLPSDTVADPRLRALLRGDLDTIVLKAMRPRPEDRYSTADALADDLGRYLDSRPVRARPERATYVVAKFVRRHRALVGASVVALLAIVVGSAVAVWQLTVARDERARADEVKAFIASIFEQATPYGADGANPTARELLRDAAGRIDGQFMNRPALRMELLLVVAGSLLQQQDLDGGEPLVDEAVRVGETHLGAEHPMTLHARLLQAQLHRHRGRTDALASELDTLVPAMRRAPVPDEQFVEALKLIAHLEIDRGRYAEAVPAAVEAERESMARLGEAHVGTVSASMALALAHVYARSYDLAVTTGEAAVRRARLAYNGNDRHPAVLDALSIYGRALAAKGDVVRGIEVLRTARDHAAALFGPGSLMVGFQSQNLVRHELDVGDVDAALADSERALAVLSAAAGTDANAMTSAYRAHGAALLAAHRYAEAAAALDRAVHFAQQAVGEAHDITLGIVLDRAAARVLAGGSAVAESARRDVESIRARLTPTRGATLRVRGLHVLGLVHLASGRPADAEAALTEALATLADGRPRRQRMQVLAALGQSQLNQGQYDRAAETLTQAQALHAELDRLPTPDGRSVDEALRRAHRGVGRGKGISSIRKPQVAGLP